MSESKQLAQSVGSKIRALRVARGLSQEKFALDCEMNPAFLGHIERGLRCPTIFTLQRICDGFGISLAELFLLDTATHQHSAALEHIAHAIEPLSAAQSEKIVQMIDQAIGLLDG